MRRFGDESKAVFFFLIATDYFYSIEHLQTSFSFIKTICTRNCAFMIANTVSFYDVSALSILWFCNEEWNDVKATDQWSMLLSELTEWVERKKNVANDHFYMWHFKSRFFLTCVFFIGFPSKVTALNEQHPRIIQHHKYAHSRITNAHMHSKRMRWVHTTQHNTSNCRFTLKLRNAIIVHYTQSPTQKLQTNSY